MFNILLILFTQTLWPPSRTFSQVKNVPILSSHSIRPPASSQSPPQVRTRTARAHWCPAAPRPPECWTGARAPAPVLRPVWIMWRTMSWSLWTLSQSTTASFWTSPATAPVAPCIAEAVRGRACCDTPERSTSSGIRLDGVLFINCSLRSTGKNVYFFKWGEMSAWTSRKPSITWPHEWKFSHRWSCYCQNQTFSETNALNLSIDSSLVGVFFVFFSIVLKYFNCPHWGCISLFKTLYIEPFKKLGTSSSHFLSDDNRHICVTTEDVWLILCIKMSQSQSKWTKKLIFWTGK